MQDTLDYAEVGLMAGLEVHQQLLTKTKLFCRCPAGLYTSSHDGTVLRHMRPTLSELGEYDGTALMEFKTRKNIIYLLHKINTCTYEMDDTPPFLINQEAIDVGIEQCLMLGCDIVDELHIARKQYLDGSIPTGFQRTAIVGVNGRLPFRDREITITQVSVEEDSCREVSDQGHLIVWRTDRLGMPLIETVTGPDLRTPEEVEQAILLIGRVCRSTEHVRVGMGASRQDVNVSVRGGTRIEIKGVPKAGWAPGLVHGEAVRQVNLLRLRDELHRRGFTNPGDLKVEYTDVTALFNNLSIDLLRSASWRRFIDKGNRRAGFEAGEGPFTVRAIRLIGLAGILEHPTQPGLTFTHEIKGRVRVIAGLDQSPILLTDQSWIGDAGDLRALRKHLGCTSSDAVIIVWGADQDTKTAAEEIRIRFGDATLGVPSETRQPFELGHTDFERILPGPDRMYPDTDSPPLAIERQRVHTLEESLPERPWIRETRYLSAGVPLNTVHYLIRRGGARLVDLVVDRSNADLRTAAFFFGERLKGLRRAGVATANITDDQWVMWFALLKARPVVSEAWVRVVRWMADHPGESPADFVRNSNLGEAPDGWQETVAGAAATRRPDHASTDPGQLGRFLSGVVMEKLRGMVPAIKVVQRIDSEITS